jgi:hypothetical protein
MLGAMTDAPAPSPAPAPEALAAAMVAALADPDQGFGRELAALVVAAALDRPLAAYVEVSALTPIVVEAVGERTTARLQQRHQERAWTLLREHAAATDDALGELVPERAREGLRDVIDRWLADPSLPRARWADGAIDPVIVRKLVAPALQQTLQAFARKLPFVGGGAASGGAMLGGLAGALGRHAGALADVGRSVMGGIGKEMEAKLQQLAKDFSESAVTELRDAMIERLRTHEGRSLTIALADRVLEALWTAKITELMDDADALRRAELLELVPVTLAHVAAHPHVRAAAEAQVAAVLALEGQLTLRDHLREAGVEPAVVAELERQALALIPSIPAQPLLARLLTAVWGRVHI